MDTNMPNWYQQKQFRRACALTVRTSGKSVIYRNYNLQQENTAENQWLRENCSRYGFILRYPRGKEDITQIDYESWHFRYVGVEAAQEIMSRGITLEEYLGKA